MAAELRDTWLVASGLDSRVPESSFWSLKKPWQWFPSLADHTISWQTFAKNTFRMTFLEMRMGIFLFMKLSWPFWRMAQCGDSCLRQQLVKPGFTEEETESCARGRQLSKVSWATPSLCFWSSAFPQLKKKLAYMAKLLWKLDYLKSHGPRNVYFWLRPDLEKNWRGILTFLSLTFYPL